MKRLLLLFLVAGLSAWTPATAQTLELRANGIVSGHVTTGIGDTVQIDVWAQLDCLAVSGIDLHLSQPAGVFEVIDRRLDHSGVQPFSGGALFARATTVYNGINDHPEAAAPDRLLLRYAAVTGPAPPRGLQGQGPVASFSIIAVGPVDHAQLRIEDTPILETKLVLPDGTTERRFDSLVGIELSAEPRPTITRQRPWAHVKRIGAQ